MPRFSPLQRRCRTFPVRTPEQREVSRRELMRLVEQWGRDIQRANQAHEETFPRRKAIITSTAKALVLRDPDPGFTQMWLHRSGPPRPVPTRWQMEGYARRAKAHVPNIEGLDGAMSPWTGGFWTGLRLSRALVAHRGYPRIQPGRPWLEADLERLPIPGRLSPPDQDGRRWLVRCQAWRVTPADSFGADVLAGLFSGARREDDEDGATWLAVPCNESVRRLLDYWKIPIMKGTRPDQLLVSPFWGAILPGYMPPACAGSMLVRRAGGCPLIPAVLYDLLWGPSPRHGYVMPVRANELPFLCSHATRIRRGWTRDYLRRTAALTGMLYVPSEMRHLLKQWRTRNQTGFEA